MAKFNQGDRVRIQTGYDMAVTTEGVVIGLAGGQGVDGECCYTIELQKTDFVSRSERDVSPAPQKMTDIDRMRSALVGLLADIRDHWEGNERDLDVIAEDIAAEFGLAAEVAEALTGATTDPDYDDQGNLNAN